MPCKQTRLRLCSWARILGRPCCPWWDGLACCLSSKQEDRPGCCSLVAAGASPRRLSGAGAQVERVPRIGPLVAGGFRLVGGGGRRERAGLAPRAVNGAVPKSAPALPDGISAPRVATVWALQPKRFPRGRAGAVPELCLRCRLCNELVTSLPKRPSVSLAVPAYARPVQLVGYARMSTWEMGPVGLIDGWR